MKHILPVVLIAGLACAGFMGCDGGKSGSTGEETVDRNASYALGMVLGTNLKSDNIIVNMDDFTQGIKDVLFGSKTRYDMYEAHQIFEEAFNKLAEERNSEIIQAEMEFLAENSQKPGINITGNGLQYEVISEGDGARPNALSTVRVHYEGTLTDGSVFDSSYSRGEPAEFPLSMVIPGWTEGIQLMSVGSKYRLFIPSNLGYGSQGAGPQVPPYSTLIFEVELLEILQDE